MILQAIVAAVAGIIFFFKSNWRKLSGKEVIDEETKEPGNIDKDSDEDNINKAS